MWQISVNSLRKHKYSYLITLCYSYFDVVNGAIKGDYILGWGFCPGILSRDYIRGLCPEFKYVIPAWQSNSVDDVELRVVNIHHFNSNGVSTTTSIYSCSAVFSLFFQFVSLNSRWSSFQLRCGLKRWEQNVASYSYWRRIGVTGRETRGSMVKTLGSDRYNARLQPFRDTRRHS